jgi:XRE family aerobic/anaerobic benzoate catabolism transcriptional regulator
MPRSTKPRRASAGRAKPRRADPHDVAYLGTLADKIRDARAQRGMTRNALAADSGVSLRFLAQLEGGQGNPSILVLRRIASAMGFPADDLLSEDRALGETERGAHLRDRPRNRARIRRDHR